MSEVVWLMDVDGVLNNWDFPDPVVHDDYKSFKSGNGFVITYSESLLERIRDMHSSGLVTVKWLSTWQSLANTHLREEFGFTEDLEVEGGDCDMPWDGVWWKLPIAQEAYNKYDRVVWTDDDIFHSSDAKNWLHMVRHDNRIKHISPENVLTHDHVDIIEDWIKNETN